jgi:hypothetical protein
VKIDSAPKFQPITITLETEKEAALLKAILDGVMMGDSGDNMAYEIWCVLDGVVSGAYYEHESGVVKIREI